MILYVYIYILNDFNVCLKKRLIKVMIVRLIFFFIQLNEIGWSYQVREKIKIIYVCL